MTTLLWAGPLLVAAVLWLDYVDKSWRFERGETSEAADHWLRGRSRTRATRSEPMKRTKHGGLGWRPDVADPRDLPFEMPKAVHLPSHVDLRDTKLLPPVYDQGALGSCTANAVAAAVEFDLKKQGLPDFAPSRLFIYYNERVIEHTVHDDAGAMIRDGFKSIAHQGVCPESDWPYIVDDHRYREKPPAKCYTEALLSKAIKYRAVHQSAYSLRYVIAQGFPVVFGFTVYESFESDDVARTGVVPMPAPGEAEIGGHATALVGYTPDDFIGRNSWGGEWGDRGYFRIPAKYITDPDLASDFWTVQAVS